MIIGLAERIEEIFEMAQEKRYHSLARVAPKKLPPKDRGHATQLPLAGIVASDGPKGNVAGLPAIPAAFADSWCHLVADYRRLEKELAEERINNQALRLAAAGNLPALPVVGRW